MKWKIIIIFMGIFLVLITGGIVAYSKMNNQSFQQTIEDILPSFREGIIMALTDVLIPNACDACTLADIDTYDANYDTLDKNEIWIIDYTTLSCSSINSAEICLDIWNQGSAETVTFECSVDGSTWDKCGTNTFSPATEKTTYCYTVTSGVTCSNLADFQSKLTSNDAGGPNDFYLDFTNVSIDYEEAVEGDCWGEIPGGIYVPGGCVYYIPDGENAYIT